MSTSKKQNGTTTGERKGQITKKSGKGLQEGVMSELATYWNIKPGHEDELRAACLRFGDMLHRSEPNDIVRTGLRDARLTIFNNSRQFSFFTTFETDFDPYLDDAILIVGLEHFVDWLQHLVESEKFMAEVESIGGLKKFDRNDPDFEGNHKRFSAKLKALVQSVQIQSISYFNPLSGLTNPQITKAQRLHQTFQQVLDDPAAEEALKHPALKPLLEQAAE
jgi:hypothetical protein